MLSTYWKRNRRNCRSDRPFRRLAWEPGARFARTPRLTQRLRHPTERHRPTPPMAASCLRATLRWAAPTRRAPPATRPAASRACIRLLPPLPRLSVPPSSPIAAPDLQPSPPSLPPIPPRARPGSSQIKPATAALRVPQRSLGRGAALRLDRRSDSRRGWGQWPSRYLRLRPVSHQGLLSLPPATSCASRRPTTASGAPPALATAS